MDMKPAMGQWFIIFLIKKLKILRWTYVIIDLSFKKNNCKNQIKKSLELKKLSREEMINYMLNRKNTTIL